MEKLKLKEIEESKSLVELDIHCQDLIRALRSTRWALRLALLDVPKDCLATHEIGKQALELVED